MSKKRERTVEDNVICNGPDPSSAESLLFQLASDTTISDLNQSKSKRAKSGHNNNNNKKIDENDTAKDQASYIPAGIIKEKHPAAVAPSSTLRHCDGLDVVRKGSRGRGRQLMILPGMLGLGKSAVGGKLGTLKEVTSASPVLYIEFPDGRLKCTGRTIHTKGRFFTLYADKASGKASRMDCRDVFDSVVCFSKACWVGKAQDNPNEDPLPLPDSLQALSEDSAGSGGKDDFRTYFGGGNPASPLKGRGISSKRRSTVDEAEGSAQKPGAEGAEEGSPEREATAAVAGLEENQPRRSSSRATKSKVTYLEDSDDMDDEEGDNDGSSSSEVESSGAEEGVPVGIGKKDTKEDAGEPEPEAPEVFAILDEPTAARKPATVGSGRERQKKAPTKTPAKGAKNRRSSSATKGKSRRTLSSSGSDDDGSGSGDGGKDYTETPASDEDENGDTALSATAETPRRSSRASTMPRVKYTQSSGSEEEEPEEVNEEDGEDDEDEEEFGV